jgi:hypothetical protein
VALKKLLKGGAHLDTLAEADGDSSDAGAEDGAAAPALEARVDSVTDDLAVSGAKELSPTVAVAAAESGTLDNGTLPSENAEPASAVPVPVESEAVPATATVTEPRRAHASTARFAAPIRPAAAAARCTHASAATSARTAVRIATTTTSAMANNAAAMSRCTA